MKQLLSLLILSVVSLSLAAHNVVGGVYANGADIEGEVGFSNGAMAKAGTIVKVFDESGQPLGETQTDNEGFFVYHAQKHITYVFDINLGAGHRIKMSLPADELPDSLGGGNVATNIKPLVSSEPISVTTTLTADRLEQAIAKQIKPLRREISALKEKSGMRDIIGGIGYIFGLLGLVALLRERRLKAKQ